eukprot:7998122-Ditylum_brightwellii.AAC.1
MRSHCKQFIPRYCRETSIDVARISRNCRAPCIKIGVVPIWDNREKEICDTFCNTWQHQEANKCSSKGGMFGSTFN